MYTYTCTHRAYTLSLTLNICLNFTVLLQSSTWLASFFCTTVRPGWNPLFSQWDEKLSFHMSLCRTRSHPSLREGGWKVEHGSRAVMKLWPTLTSRRVWGLYPRLPMDRGEPKAPSDSGKLTIESHAYIFFLDLGGSFHWKDTTTFSSWYVLPRVHALKWNFMSVLSSSLHLGKIWSTMTDTGFWIAFRTHDWYRIWANHCLQVYKYWGHRLFTFWGGHGYFVSRQRADV